MIRKVVKILWIFIALISLVCVFIFFSIAKGWIGYMPPVEDLENPNYKFATEVFSEDGKVLGTYSYSKENRVFVGYNDLSPNIINALIATEDVRFAEHSGIDAYALTRAVVKRGILMQKNAGGGSTITQQLSKQLYSPSADNVMERLFQKPIEWVIAVKLERYYTKEEILTMYLNKFDFLNNAVGIKTAAFTYFGCEPKDLKIEEAATLVGMCKNPSLYNPVRYNERSRGRRNVVLDQMRKAGYITEAERDSLQALPLKLKYNRVDHKEGLATYFREYLRGVLTAKKPDKANYRGWQMQKYYEDSLDWENNPLFGWCEKNTKKDGTKYNLYTDGLKKYCQTSINTTTAKPTTDNHTWIIYRLGEFYLNYAEALFKYLGTAYATNNEFPIPANEMVSKTRRRTKVNMPKFPAGLDNKLWWEKYQNERMVELAFEGHRFWDVRRWKEGDKHFSSIDAMKIYKSGDSYSYRRVTVNRQWDDKMYFFPIPQSEKAKNPNLTQNPGW